MCNGFIVKKRGQITDPGSKTHGKPPIMTRRRATRIGVGLVIFQAAVMFCIIFAVLARAIDSEMGPADGGTSLAQQPPEGALATFQPDGVPSVSAATPTPAVPTATSTPVPVVTAAQPAVPTASAPPTDVATDVTADVAADTSTPLVSEPTAETLPPLPPAVNGVPLDEIAVIPPRTKRNIRAIYEAGQRLGNNARAFSKVGDSTIENPFFLARFDEGPYNLGEYAHLQGVIDYFSGSYGRQSMSVRRSLHSWTVMDPAWADKSLCLANESPIACEFRQQRPSIVLIRLGSNDAGVPAYFEQNIRQIVAYSIEQGVVPVLGTKADRIEGRDNTNNEILRRIAADLEVPLWDFDRVAGTLPGRGLDLDNVHLTTFYAHDYTSPLAMQRGHAMHNLTALLLLDAIWNEVIQDNS
jgi:hypothetical protein